MDAVQESNSQLVQAWRLFSKSSPGRDFHDRPGLRFAWGEVPNVAYNAIILAEPLTSPEEFNRLAVHAIEYMRTKSFTGVFMVCDNWAPQSAQMPPLLKPAWKMTGMATEILSAPVGPLTTLDLRRVADRQTLIDLYDINSAGYGTAPELGRASTGPVEDWNENTFGYVAYQAGQPVACAATFPLDNRLYVGLVATVPHAQRRGYAEAVMRHSIEQARRTTGLSRIILHASDAGFPLYSRMGFRATSKFSVYYDALTSVVE